MKCPKRAIALLAFFAAAAVLAQTVSAPESQAQPPPAGNPLEDSEVGRLFDNPLPGLSQIRSTPRVTGNAGADARIRDVAVSRGYRRRGEPLDAMGSYQGRALQQRAIDDLVQLQTAMASDIGSRLTLTSGQRSVSRQRGLFLGRLRSSSLTLRGRMVSNSEIGAGRADDVLNHAMRRAAPPGFSRHHTGLAIDVASDGLALFGFANSRAYDWLSENRYENAMRYGWIPSYPPNAASQGPAPEPWEWVWIGRDSAECAREITCAGGGLTGAVGRTTGWAIAANATAVRDLRLLTFKGTERLTTSTVRRFDVATAYDLDDPLVGFDAPELPPSGSRWACVEARTRAGGPWNPIGCLVLN